MSPHQDEHDDAEFDAFLNREGALASALQQLPQPAPSGELSKAILADAERAVPLSPAANAPYGGDGRQQAWMPHFLRQYRAPLGVAASIIFAVTIGMQWQAPSDETRMEEAAPIQPAPEPAPAALTPAQQADQPAMPATAKKPTPARSKEAIIAVMPAPAPAPEPVRAPAPEAVRAPVAVPAPPPTLALAPAPAPAPAQVSAPIQVSAATREVSAPAPAKIIITGSSNVRAQSEPSNLGAPVTLALSRSTAATSAERKALNDDGKPKAWLAVIEEMLKAGLDRDAKMEWEKFQAAYPNYAVPAELKEKISGSK
jgi:hypothetical protein